MSINRFRLKRRVPFLFRYSIWAGAAWLWIVNSSFAQPFSFNSTELPIAIAPGFNHAQMRVPVVPAHPEFDYSALSISSDASWVSATVDTQTGEAVLDFATSNLIASSYTATITASQGTNSASLFVTTSLSPLNLLCLADDPVRSRVYGIHQNETNLGAVVVYDPIQETPIASITVGQKPSDLAITHDGRELLVINSAEASLSVIDLSTLRVSETIALPEYANHSSGPQNADIGIGPGDIIYYTDGAWAPALRVYNRRTHAILQTATEGIGDFAVSHDGTSLIGWYQYGWGAGWAGSYILRFSIAADGQLTFAEQTSSSYPTVIGRDPTDTPVLIQTDDKKAYVKQLAVEAKAVTNTIHAFPQPVYAISPQGEIVSTDKTIYETATGISLLDLPTTTPVQMVTKDYARLVYFDPTSRCVKTVHLLEQIGPAILGRTLSPANGAIVLPPSSLAWSPVPGSIAYDVYLSETNLTDADIHSDSFRGTSPNPSFAMASPLAPGTYFWRVDCVSEVGTSIGEIHSFTVSPFSISTNLIQTATVQGHATHQVTFQLNSAIPGKTWSITASEPWASFSTSTGVTPATVTVVMDASQLSVGVHSAELHISDVDSSTVSISVQLAVDPLQLTHLKSDSNSKRVYAISEDAERQPPRAYLLELDSEAEKITRVVPVGYSVTDLAIHNAEQRIWIPNWTRGSLLAVNMSTFEVETGLSCPDPYRVSAGTSGRLIVEGEDQWIHISILDTATGNTLGSEFAREGGGGSASGGRYYYHGDNNSSAASVQKYDLLGDAFQKLSEIRVDLSWYYGSRTVVVSETGNRVFWNGGLFDDDLNLLWEMGPETFSTSADGRLAFGQDQIFDTTRRQTVLNMPISTSVSAFNSTTEKLVLQVGSSLRFFHLGNSTVLPTPSLSVTHIQDQAISLSWTSNSLSLGFTLQSRIAKTGEWADVQADLNHLASSFTVTGLAPNTGYEFRIKANSPAYSSMWSDEVDAITLSRQPSTPYLSYSFVGNRYVQLEWSSSDSGDQYILERKCITDSNWMTLATLSISETTFLDSTVESQTTYQYRVKSIAPGAESPYSNIQTMTTPILLPPPAPTGLDSISLSSYSIGVIWSNVPDALGYRLERRMDEESSWSVLAELLDGEAGYMDTNVVEGLRYWYRVYAFNAQGDSGYSNEDSARAVKYILIFNDNFDPEYDSLQWESLSGGKAHQGPQGFLSGNALYFSGGNTRAATTIPLDTTKATFLTFQFRAGNFASDGILWDNSEANEQVVVEYSNDGANWTHLSALDTQYPALSIWTPFEIAIPAEAQSLRTHFRWRQAHHSGNGYDVWAIDNVTIVSEYPEPPPYATLRIRRAQFGYPSFGRVDRISRCLQIYR